MYIWDDDIYDGEYKLGCKHGRGTYSWEDGPKYHGEWQNGLMHGRGEYISNDGAIKKGLWENGKRIKWLDEDE